VKPGNRAPAFTLPEPEGGVVSLGDYLGESNLLLFFYSYDFTRAQTLDGVRDKSAISLLSLAAQSAALHKSNTHALAISRDSLASHAKLAELLRLRLTLLTDESGDVGEQYGLLPENRWAGANHCYDYDCCAVIIDRNGIIRHWQTADLILSPDISLPAGLNEKFPRGLARYFEHAAAIDAGALVKIAESLGS
jgi:peroxiredoxin Q/BCP